MAWWFVGQLSFILCFSLLVSGARALYTTLEATNPKLVKASYQVSKGNVFSNHIEMATLTSEYDQDLYYLGGYVASDDPYPLPGDQADYSACICDYTHTEHCYEAVYGNCSCKPASYWDACLQDEWTTIEINSRWQEQPSHPTWTRDRVRSFTIYRFFVPQEYGRHMLHLDFRLDEGAAQVSLYDGRRYPIRLSEQESKFQDSTAITSYGWEGRPLIVHCERLGQSFTSLWNTDPWIPCATMTGTWQLIVESRYWYAHWRMAIKMIPPAPNRSPPQTVSCNYPKPSRLPGSTDWFCLQDGKWRLIYTTPNVVNYLTWPLFGSCPQLAAINIMTQAPKMWFSTRPDAPLVASRSNGWVVWNFGLSSEAYYSFCPPEGENTTIFAGIQTPENIYSVTIHSDPGKFLLIPFEDLVTYAGVNWLRGATTLSCPGRNKIYSSIKFPWHLAEYPEWNPLPPSTTFSSFWPVPDVLEYENRKNYFDPRWLKSSSPRFQRVFYPEVKIKMLKPNYRVIKAGFLFRYSTSDAGITRQGFIMDEDTLSQCTMEIRPIFVNKDFMGIETPDRQLVKDEPKCVYEEFVSLIAELREAMQILDQVFTIDKTEYWKWTYWFQTMQLSPVFLSCKQLIDQYVNTTLQSRPPSLCQFSSSDDVSWLTNWYDGVIPSGCCDLLSKSYPDTCYTAPVQYLTYDEAVSLTSNETKLAEIDSSADPKCFKSVMEDYIGQEAKAQSHQCAKISIEPTEYLYKNLEFWDICVEQVFGVGLRGVSCFAHGDCKSHRCNFQSNKCMLTQQEQEDFFIECLEQKMPSLVKFVLQEQFRAKNLYDIKAHLQTQDECHKKYEEGWLLGKRTSYMYMSSEFLGPYSCDHQPWSFSEWIEQIPMASQGRFIYGRDYELGQKTKTGTDGLSWRFNLPRIAAQNQGCAAEYRKINPAVGPMYSIPWGKDACLAYDEWYGDNICFYHNCSTPNHCNRALCDQTDKQQMCAICTGDRCLELPEYTTKQECENAHLCVTADNKVLRVSQDQCDNLGVCSEKCFRDQCKSWRMVDNAICYNASATSSDLCTNTSVAGWQGHWREYVFRDGNVPSNPISAALCIFPTLQTRTACEANGLVYESCESLTLDECERCMHNESACPIQQQNFLKCQIEFWGKCDNKEQCESQGKCSDREALTNDVYPYPKGSENNLNISTCFLIEAQSWFDPPGTGMYGIGGYEGNGQWSWIMNSNIRLYGDFWGYFAYNFDKPEECLIVGTNPVYTWQLTLYFGSSLVPRLMWPAINEDQCTNNYGYGCEIIQFINSVPATTKWLVRSTESQCAAIGGKWRPFYTWSPGKWYPAQMVSPTWIDRPIKSMHYWGQGFDYLSLYGELEKIVEDTYKFKLQSELECEFYSRLEIIDSVVCYIMTNSTDCMENLQEIASGAFTVCTGEAPLLFAPPNVVSFYDDTLEAVSGECILVRFFAASASKMSSPEKKQSLSTFASYSVALGSYEVINSNDVIMGQVLSNGLQIKTDPPTMLRRLDLCFEKLEFIPEDPKFSFMDVVRERNGEFKMLRVTVNSSLCATVSNMNSGDVLYLARRIDQPDKKEDKLSSGETGLMYAMAAQYLLLVLMAIIFLLILVATMTFNIIHYFVLLMMPFFIIRTIYFFLVATEVMQNASNVGEYLVFELGTFLYFTAFSYILLHLCLVIMKTKSHRASTLPMWVVWVIIVVLVWLGFGALIILYATLPNDTHETVCDQRKGGVDKTNDSQYVLGIVYRVFVTAVAAIIAVLFIISGTWIVSMVRKLSKDKSLSAAKVLRVGIVCCCSFLAHAVILLIIAIVEWGSTYSVIFLIGIETIPSFLMLLILFPRRRVPIRRRPGYSGGSGTTSTDSSGGASSYQSTMVLSHSITESTDSYTANTSSDYPQLATNHS